MGRKTGCQRLVSAKTILCSSAQLSIYPNCASQSSLLWCEYIRGKWEEALIDMEKRTMIFYSLLSSALQQMSMPYMMWAGADLHWEIPSAHILEQLWAAVCPSDHADLRHKQEKAWLILSRGKQLLLAQKSQVFPSSSVLYSMTLHC